MGKSAGPQAPSEIASRTTHCLWRRSWCTARRREHSHPYRLGRQEREHHLADYQAAVIRNSSLPALLGLDSLAEHNAVIQCRTGEIWFTDERGCDIKPRGAHVHMQMVKSRHGNHWYIPIGRFNETMTQLGETLSSGHLATSSTTPACGKASPSCSA